MNWSDEKYVKLYVRQTATWRMWPWQGRAILPLLLQVANGAGLIDVGGKDPLTGLAVLIMMPREVVEPGLAALLEDGTVERVSTGYLIPKYLEAQEATKTDARKKADQRDRERAKARGNTKSPVTESHQSSPGVPLQPSPAQPPAHEKTAGEKPPAPAKDKPPKVEKQTDPRHAPLVKVLCDGFEALRGIKYPFKKRDAAAVSDLLAAADPDTIAQAWARALRHRGFPTVSSLPELVQHLAHFVGTGPPAPAPRAPEFDPNQGIIRSAPREDPFPWNRP